MLRNPCGRSSAKVVQSAHQNNGTGCCWPTLVGWLHRPGSDVLAGIITGKRRKDNSGLVRTVSVAAVRDSAKRSPLTVPCHLTQLRFCGIMRLHDRGARVLLRLVRKSLVLSFATGWDRAFAPCKGGGASPQMKRGGERLAEAQRVSIPLFGPRSSAS